MSAPAQIRFLVVFMAPDGEAFAVTADSLENADTMALAMARGKRGLRAAVLAADAELGGWSTEATCDDATRALFATGPDADARGAMYSPPVNARKVVS